MELSAELISQFAKITNDNKSDKKTETTMFGTVKLYDGAYYVQLDGSDLLTPVTTTTDVAEGERVTVMIKDHSATVTGNVSSPSARTDDVKDVGDKVEEIGKQITEFETVVADKVSTKQLQAEVAKITKLEADYVTVNKTLEANNASIKKLEAEDVTIKGTLEAQNGKITNLETDKLSARDADIKYATIENLDATNATIRNLNADFGEFEELTAQNFTAANAEINDLKTNKLSAVDADLKYATIANLNATNGKITNLEAEDVNIKNTLTAQSGKITNLESENVTINNTLTAQNGKITNLETNKLDAKSAEILYANIDFANIEMAAIKKLFTDSGIIKDLVVSEGKITGELVGVTIKGDLIEGNTIKADKLVVKGSDGLYYKLNFESGNFDSAEEVPDDGIHGSVIVANSITAEKIAVDDLVAFDATIGGFHITSSALYSGAKESVSNTTRGIYLDNTGQMALGDSSNFLKYYKDSSGKYHLEISASSLKFGTNGTSVESAISGVQTNVNNVSNDLANNYYNKSSVDSSIGNVQTNVTNLSNNLANNYYNKTTMDSKLEVTEESIKSEVSSTYATKTALTQTNTNVTAAQNAANAAQKDVDNLETNVTTNYATKSLVEQTASGITSTVSSTYATKTDLNTTNTNVTNAKNAADAAQKDIDDYKSTVSTTYATKSELTQKADSITSSVSSTYATKTALNQTNTNVTTAQNTADAAKTAAQTAQGEVDAVETNLANNYYKKTEVYTKSEVSQTANSISLSVSTEKINEIEIGSRNLLLNSSFTKNLLNWGSSGAEIITIDGVDCAHITGALSTTYTVSQNVLDKIDTNDLTQTYVFSADVRLDNYVAGTTNPYVQLYFSGSYDNNGTSTWMGATTVSGVQTCNSYNNQGWVRMVWVVKFAKTPIAMTIYMYARDFTGDLYFKNLQLEKGNKATEWMPSPDDVDEDIGKVNDLADAANNTATEALSALQILEGKIQTLVDGMESSSLVTQTEDGWTFSMTTYTDVVNTISNNLSLLDEKSDKDKTELLKAIEGVNTRTAYVHMGEYTYKNDAGTDVTEICLELGDDSSDKKLIITNTQILFQVGSNIPTRIDTDGVVTDNITVEGEMRHTNPNASGYYYWELDTSGFIGLFWKGA